MYIYIYIYVYIYEYVCKYTYIRWWSGEGLRLEVET